MLVFTEMDGVNSFLMWEFIIQNCFATLSAVFLSMDISHVVPKLVSVQNNSLNFNGAGW